jgi:phage baseplate assembly protein W
MVDTEIYGTDYDSHGLLTSSGDIGLVTELTNAEQAIHNRLMTRLGTYPTIDTEYGSEVHQILGEKTTPELINELSVYIQNCMLEEPRVYSIITNEITKVDHDTLRINLILQLVDGSEIGFTEEINTLG